jgi:molybdopterin-guanine dinucleotide biosynthesis protein A
MPKITAMTGVVLAGGRSRRMGRDKAWLSLRGRPLVSHQAALLAAVFEDVRISAKEIGKLAEFPYPVIPDRDPADAPIFGLRASLQFLRHPIFALAVDMPRVPVPLIQAIAERFLEAEDECLVPRARGKLQTLCGAYGSSLLPRIESHIAAKKLSLHELVAASHSEIWEEAAWSPFAAADDFLGLNTPEDYETVNLR